MKPLSADMMWLRLDEHVAACAAIAMVATAGREAWHYTLVEYHSMPCHAMHAAGAPVLH
jgi:hypothetical protein